MPKKPNSSDSKSKLPQPNVPPPDLKHSDFQDEPPLGHVEVPEVELDLPEAIDAEGGVSFDLPADLAEDSGALTQGIALEDLANLPEAAGLSDVIPAAKPASSGKLGADSGVPLASAAPPGSSVVLATGVESDSADIGNLEPVAPVAPASGWFEAPVAEGRASEPLEAPLEVQPADLFEAAPPIESSDIFTGGPIPQASGADQSDVIAATAYGPARLPRSPDKPDRKSDIALTFDQPPGGSTIDDAGAGDDLPVADELGDGSDSLFGTDELEVTPLRSDSDNDVSDYGATPISAPDASSILSDPGEISVEESSAVRLEAPGVGRTHGSDEGTEFDLTITDDPVHPELAAAEAALDDDTTDWRQQSGSDLFSEARTSPEIDIGDDSGSVAPVNPSLQADEPSLTSSPSSIFSGGKVPGSKSGTPGSDSVRIGRPAEEEDAAVEFSDHPTADPEASSAGLAGPLTPARGTKPPAKDDDDGGHIDWSAAALADSDEATMGYNPAMLDAPLSGILKRGKEKSPDEEKTREERPSRKTGPAKAGKAGKAGGKDGTDPSVEIDWMAGSSSEEPAVSEEAIEQKTARKDKEKAKEKKAEASKKKSEPRRESETSPAKRSSRGWVGGTLVGMVLAGGTCAGLYYGGIIPPPQGESTAQTRGRPGGETNSAVLPKAVAESKATTGQAKLFARLQNSAAISADDAELKMAREDLQAAVDDANASKTPEGEREAVKAAIQLGVTYELAGDWKKARQVYDDGLKKFPAKKAWFEAALDRLDATKPAGDGMSRRPAPADIEAILFALVLLEGEASASPEDEAGIHFWKAVKLAAANNPAEAILEISKAKTVHAKQARAQAGRGLNPLSDPLEQIFPRCCDDLKAYWELRAAVYSNKAVAELIEKEGAKEAMTTLASARTKALEAVKLMADLKEAGDKLAKAQKDLKDAQDAFATKEKDYIAKLDQGKVELAATTDKFTTTETERKKLEDMVGSLAKELQAAKLLGEKYDAAGLLAAQKAAAERATGPTLSGLAPPGMMAVGGSPLTAAQLIDVSARLSRSETVAKAATDKLASETKRLTTEHEAAVKKLMESQAAETKKLADTHTASVAKLKDAGEAELKKLSEKAAQELKTLKEEQVAAMKKLTDGYEDKVKSLEATVAKERAMGEAQAATLRAEMKNSVTPTQALDLWLPQLTELRRPANADPAIANAAKVLASAPAGSEDLAKAQTVTGLGCLLKGELNGAKEMFKAAQASPAYAKAAGKEWAKAADIGLASVTDPLAPYRLPVERPKRDVKLAAYYIDAGMRAYSAGRYQEAATALVEATKADATNPLAWYYLGAARWAEGDRNQAKADFRQGGESEKRSSRTARAIADSLAPIQGAARDALNEARP